MPDLKTVDLGSTHNFFHVKNGKLIIDPASHKIKGMDVIFGGSHGLDNDMDYDIKMRVPRSLLNKNPLGQAANSAVNTGLGALAGQASKLGIKIEQSEFINLDVNVGGTPSKPKFSVNLLGAEGKSGQSLGGQVANTIKNEANKLKEEAERKAKEEAERLKAEAEAALKAEQDRLRAEAERLKKEAEEKAKKLAQQAAQNPAGAIDSLKKTIDDMGKSTIKGLPNGIPNNLPNPFGGDKNKKDGGKKSPFGGLFGKKK